MWIKFWREFDRARVVPRLCLGFYTWQMYVAQAWFQSLPNPSAAQAAFTATVWGAFPLLLNFYMQQGVKHPEAPSGTS
jgi:hypothetical protein